jgi:nucleoid DNA-binding protein
MYLINTRRLYIPASRAIEIEKRKYGTSELEDRTIAFIIKYLKPIKKLADYSKKSAYKRINRAMFKRIIPLYQEMIFEKLLEGHSVTLPAGLGTLQIMDISPRTQSYNIATRGQTPMLVLHTIPKKTNERIKESGYDYMIVNARPMFSYIIYQYTIINNMRYPKVKVYEKHEVHKPPVNTYVTGESLQREAV